MKKQTGTAFTGAAGLQKNVDFPVKLQDKVCPSSRPAPVQLVVTCCCCCGAACQGQKLLLLCKLCMVHAG